MSEQLINNMRLDCVGLFTHWTLPANNICAVVRRTRLTVHIHNIQNIQHPICTGLLINTYTASIL